MQRVFKHFFPIPKSISPHLHHGTDLRLESLPAERVQRAAVLEIVVLGSVIALSLILIPFFGYMGMAHDGRSLVEALIFLGPIWVFFLFGAYWLARRAIFRRKLNFGEKAVTVSERTKKGRRSWQAVYSDFLRIDWGIFHIFNPRGPGQWGFCAFLVHPDPDRSIMLQYEIRRTPFPDKDLRQRVADHYAQLFGVPLAKPFKLD